MSLALYFSNQVEQLAQRLSKQIGDQLIGQDPLRPVEIIIPNTSLAKWLQISQARQRRVAMNVQYHYLETGLWHLLANLDNDADSIEPLDRHQVALRLMAILHTADLDQPLLRPLRPYLGEGDNGAPTADYDLRLWQLSRRLAWLFREYEYHRSDMIAYWLQPQSQDDPLTQCQRHLYRAAIGDRAPTADQPLGMTLHGYADRVLKRAAKVPPPREPLTSVHCFGLSQLSAFHLRLFEHLQRWFAIHIYTLNPCEAFWEDVPTPAERRSLERRGLVITSPDETHDPPIIGHPLLAAWGKSGRDHIRMLCQLTDYNFEAAYQEPAADTVLHRLQRQMLTMTPAEETTHPARLPQDRSLQMMGCPGCLREVESVHQSIIHNLESDPHLKPTDVAVLVTQMEPYLPCLELTFNRVPQSFTYNLVDAKADTQSAYGRALLDLLALTEGDFGRREVFGLIQNPCLMQRFGIASDHLRIWADWVAALGIFHSYQSPPKSPTEPAGGSFSWLQGLRRLRLARIFAATDPGRNHVANLLPYSDIHTADDELLQRFCQVVELLHEAARTLQTSAGAAWWQSMLTSLCERLFAIPPDYPGERHMRDVLYESLAEMTRTHQLGPHLPAADLSPAMVKACLADRLATINGGRGEYLTDGVTVAQLQPMRPIPFKIVYVLGLQEGIFPGRTESASLDLRSGHGDRRLGETTLPERNRYLFLETLLSARQRLYLSFINRDLEKDRPMQPCSPLVELKRHIEATILPPEKLFQVHKVPLSGHDSQRFTAAETTPWADTGMRPTLADHVAHYRSLGVWDSVAATISEPEHTRLPAFCPDWRFTPSPTDPTEPAAPTQRVTLSDLHAFLWDPVATVARRLLGPTDQMTALERFQSETDEPFVTTNPFLWELRQQTLHGWIATLLTVSGANDWRTQLAQSFDQHYADFQRRAVMPAGSFACGDRLVQMTLIEKVAEQALPVTDGMACAGRLYSQVTIGRPDTALHPPSTGETLRHPPLALQLPGANSDPATVAIEARWQWLWQRADHSWHTLVPLFKPLAELKAHAGLNAALFFTVAQAATAFDWATDDPGLTVHLIGPDSVKAVRFNVTPRKAAAYLRTLLQAYFDTRQMPWLPLQAAFKAGSGLPHYIVHPPDDRDRAAFADDLADALEQADAPLLQLVKPALVADALDRALARLSIFKPFWE